MRFIIILTLLALLYALLRFSPYPKLITFLQHDYSTRIYDDEENLLQVLPLQEGLRREWQDYEKIPVNVRKTFIRSEDKRFFYHNGVDFAAILVAFKQNFEAQKTVRGASTITMQLAKMIDKEDFNTSKTFPQKNENRYFQKICDIVNAYRLETRFTKKEILELYLNNVPFGANCDGVTTASRTIFGKELYELSQSEVEILARIPRHPSKNNPLLNENFTFDNENLIFQNENSSSPTTRYKYPYEMPHYVNYLKKNYPKLVQKSEIHLSANLKLFHHAQSLTMQALKEAENSRISNASVLVIDNENNEVLCWIGNANWYDSENNGQIDGLTALNQPGSSMKPFLYALALEKGYTPSSVLADVPKEFGSHSVYIPSNFNNRFNGPVRYRVALASSLNIPAVALLDEIGVPSYLERLQKLGFESLTKAGGGKNADLGLALGAGEVSLKELVTAFSVFTRDGVYIPLSFSKEDFNTMQKKGQKSKSHSLESQKTQVYEVDTSRIIAKFLSDKSARVKGFGYTQTFQTEYPSIFKTGTSNQYQSIVALGATKKWTVGVWMGNFSGETVIGKTGSSLPAWVAKEILDYLMKSSEGKKVNDFEEPKEYELQPICATSGMTPSKNCPSVVYEYFKHNEKKSTCTWHTGHSDGHINYPSEYQQWFDLAYRNGTINYNDSDLYIITPKNNAVFFYNNSQKEKLAISVEVSGGAVNTLFVEYDGKSFVEISRPFVFELPMERGAHKVRVKCGDEAKELEFLVK